LNRYDFIKNLYNSFKNSKYIISLIPFENDYLFKIWGINSILLNNFITYNYENIIPSDLSSKIILMVGRGDDKRKRFDLGIKAMKYIVDEIHDSEMKIISDTNGLGDLVNLVKKLKLENNVKFVGYTSNPEIYFKNASLHIFPSSTESFGLSLCETKIYGIPNILTGIDYVLPSEGGVINIYNDNPRNIAKEAIKILKNDKYRKELGNEARHSMRKFKNELTLKSWIEFILAVYKGEEYYQILIKKRQMISNKEAIYIIKRQINLLKKREPEFKNISFINILNLV
jgi:glycosyltransferase involved in cell wall biosynthesis